MLYTITMPRKMYQALRERNALENQNPQDQAAFAVFRAATPKKVARGYTYVITGERKLLVHILDYIDSLAGLAADKIVPAYEFGSDIQTLQRVSNQRPAPVTVELDD